MSPDHLAQAVTVQDGDPASMLAHYRHAVALRHAHPAMITGAQSVVTAQGPVVCFTRQEGTEVIFVAANLSDAAATVTLPAGAWAAIGDSVGAVAGVNGRADLGPWQVCLMAWR